MILTTSEELFPEYLKIFELVIEQAGEDTGNTVYKNISNILSKNRDKIDKAIEDDIPFGMFVTLLVIIILLEVHTAEKLDKLSPDETKYYIDDLFSRYLKKPTRKFTSSHGLPTINYLEYGCYIRLKDK